MDLIRGQLDELQRIIKERHDSLMAEVHEEVARSRDETYGEIAGPVTDTGDEAIQAPMALAPNAAAPLLLSDCALTPPPSDASTASACTKRPMRTRANPNCRRRTRCLALVHSCSS